MQIYYRVYARPGDKNPIIIHKFVALLSSLILISFKFKLPILSFSHINFIFKDILLIYLFRYETLFKGYNK